MNDPLAELAPTLQPSNRGKKTFLPGSHQQVLGKLEHLGRYSPVIQVLTGPQGSGKSTIVHLLSQRFPHQEAVSVHFTSNYDTNNSELLKAINDKLGIDGEYGADPSRLFAQMVSELQKLSAANRFLFLLIDNGESLDKSALNLLLETFQELDESIRPHLVISAQPVFAEKIKHSSQIASIPENLCHFVELPALDLAETTAFLEHHHAEETQLLSKSRINQVHQRSFGLPGLIEKALQQELNNPSTEQKTLNLRKLAGTSLLALALIGVSTVAGYMLWSLYTQSPSNTDQVSISLPTPVDSTKLTTPQQTKPALPPTEAAAISPSTPAIAQAQTTKAPPSLNNPEQQSSTVNTEKAGTATTVEQSPTSPTEKEPLNENPDNLIIAEQAPQTSAKDVNEEEPPVLTTPAKNKLVLQLKPAKTVSKANENAGSSLIEQPTVAEKVVASPVKPMIIKPKNPLLREDELLSWDSNGYTLQMLGARKESSVVGFIQSRADRSKFYYFSTIYKEKPWYVVVYGQYQNRDEAVTAIRSLPNDLKQRKPWARSIKGVQDDIRRK